MMTSLETISQELTLLQKEMQQSVDQMGTARQSLDLAYRRGHKEEDFLPRRFIAIKKEEQLRFDTLLHKLHHILSGKLDQAVRYSSSRQDVESLIGIRKTIRYIRNAFAGELPITPSLDQLRLITEK